MTYKNLIMNLNQALKLQIIVLSDHIRTWPDPEFNDPVILILKIDKTVTIK
jgi:hypothetical protein